MKLVFDYRLLAVGANITPGSRSLNFAEKDAKDFYDAFTGPRGPVSANDASVLVGRSATCQRLLDALVALALQPAPDMLVLYFAGHGNADGIGLADDFVSYDRLRRALIRVSAKRMLLIFDTCQAGALVDLWKSDTEIKGSVDTDWLHLLANARPGIRIIAATSSTGAARENRARQNGAFTSAFLRSLKLATSDLYWKTPQGFVSDLAAFQLSVGLLHDEGFEQTPRQLNVTGDFPLFRGHYGSARVVKVSREELGEASIHIRTRWRRKRPIFVKSLLFDRRGRIIRRWISDPIVPKADLSAHLVPLRLPYVPDAGQSIPIQVLIVNKLGRILDNRCVEVEAVDLIEDALAS